MQIDQGIYDKLHEIADIDWEDGEEAMESLGMYDHEGIRRFGMEYAASIAGTKPVARKLPPGVSEREADIGGSFAFGFYLGLSWARSQEE